MPAPAPDAVDLPAHGARCVARALVPLLSLGLLAWAPFTWTALRARSAADAKLAAGAFAGALLGGCLMPRGLGTALLLTLAVGGAALAAIRTPRTRPYAVTPVRGGIVATVGAAQAVALLAIIGIITSPSPQETAHPLPPASLTTRPAPASQTPEAPETPPTESPASTPPAPTPSTPPTSSAPSTPSAHSTPSTHKPSNTPPPPTSHPVTAPPATPHNAAPPAAAKSTCEIVSNSGNCYRAGQFCRSRDRFRTTHDATGHRLKCTPNTRGQRWTRD
ncbi:IgA FC receptor precursor [Streptomyces sp. YIM 130001]|uniref:hypothetical protein n=1 Tax=Streptomyces sp. YIM 130001 TaxID=2259644 RepID=UPI000E65BD3F|nr:hypothetical protein [Streptomyces sp. YIM 130001]RII13794.1 IgA FC receptor precursor [Streptomyces sp. YIM 130001]